MGDSNARRYEAYARSTDVFGRVLCGCRDQHFVVDGPIQNGCPGEAVTPVESFLAGVAACAVELLQVVARERNVPLRSARVAIAGTIDRGHPVRPDLALFNSVRLDFRLAGIALDQAAPLVEAFQGR